MKQEIIEDCLENCIELLNCEVCGKNYRHCKTYDEDELFDEVVCKTCEVRRQARDVLLQLREGNIKVVKG